MSVTAPLSREQIMAILPHRDPFLLLDEVVELEPGTRERRRRARRARDTYIRSRGRAVIGRVNGRRIGITGLGVHVPERVLTNEELSTFLDTSDEWIVTRTGI